MSGDLKSMRYELFAEQPTVESYLNIRKECGLSQRSRVAAEKGLRNALFSVLVREGEEVIGMGRIIGDGGCWFQIVDVAVLPIHQGSGLGSRIMESLMAWLLEYAPKSSMVTLIADGKAADLYARFGFQSTQPHSHGMLMRL